MVEIVSYESKYASAFRDLNYAWIERLFEVEDSDREILENPENSIIEKGGDVLIALLNGAPVGACALIKKDDSTFELAKMAVSEKSRGNQIGWKLGVEIVEKAKQLGAKKLFLETNSQLKPAISLYNKLGFKDVSFCESPYERCDVQMELKF